MDEDPPIAGMGMLDLVDEVKRLRAERDRLADGIREHREYARRVGDEPGLNDRMLWPLLDVAGDDESTEGHERGADLTEGQTGRNDDNDQPNAQKRPQ